MNQAPITVKPPIIVVAGFGRCGTTMVMHMLRAGGIHPFPGSTSTGLELDRIFDLPDDHEWLAEGAGHALKLLDPHKNPIPRGYDCRYVYILRNARQQARSSCKLLRMMFPGDAIDDIGESRLAQSIRDEEPALLRARGNSPCLVLRFEQILSHPHVAAAELAAFVQRPFDTAAAAAVVIPRAPECAPGFEIEARLSDEADDALEREGC